MLFFTSNEKTQWQTHTNKPDTTNTTLSLDGSVHQQWEGFGGCFNELSQLALLDLSETDRDRVYDDLFSQDGDGLRLDYCRLPIGASDYALSWYSHNETPGDYDMQHFSISRDQQYLIPYKIGRAHV